MKRNLTDKLVGSESGVMRPPAKGNKIIWDENGGAGFGVRIAAGGTIAFVLEYRNKLGVSRRFTVARWDELPKDEKKGKVERAREMARGLRAEIDKGGDPVQAEKDEIAKAKGEKNVKELCEEYMKRHVMLRNGPDQKKNARRMVDTMIIPRWGDRKLSTLKKCDVIDLHNETRAKHRCTACRAFYAAELAACPKCKSTEREPAGLYSANQLLTVIKAMFNHGIEWGWCATNPAEGIKRHPEDKRQTWLDETKLAALDRAITQYGKDSGELIRLLLLSGSRRGEWMRAQKKNFDLVHAIWMKPSDSVKAGVQEHVPLNAATMVVLRRVIASTKKEEPYLFPGASKGKPRATVRRPWIQILKLAGLAQEYTVAGKRGPLTRWRPTIRLHDLRHSYASWLADNGEPLRKIGQLLGHRRPETTSRYAHIADRSLRNTTNRFGEMISKAVQ
jgi:integrase